MKKKLLVLLFSLATLGLVSCGGGNDVASSGASAVSAAAPASNASPASVPSTPATTATEPKVNGQIDERTGVAPVVAAMTPWSPTANGGCLQVTNYAGLSSAQQTACNIASTYAVNQWQCSALGGTWPYQAPPPSATPCQPSSFCWPCYFNNNP